MVRTFGPLFLLTLAATASAQKPVDYVSPFVGTDGHGHTYPGATVPFGMVQLSPDTRTDTWDGCSGYHYSDGTILGFSHTHLSGTGIGCMGDIMVMPFVGKPDEAKVASRFSHKEESAKPGYYKVFLQDPKVTAELTAAAHSGLHRYTFPASDDAYLAIDLVHGVQNDEKDSALKVEDPSTISGFRKSGGWGGERTVYFVMRFSRPIQKMSIASAGATDKTTGLAGMELKGKVRASFGFRTKAGEAIEVKVGISPTGVEGARKNLDAEIPGWDFAKVRNAAEKKWTDALSNTTVESTDPKIKRTFYSNLYLAYQAPNLFNDVDGSYYGEDHKVHPNPGFANYSTFSLWDTYRALNPLVALLQPEHVNGMVRSLVAEYDESGHRNTGVWPLAGNETWCMIGNHSIPVIADAYIKGYRGFDGEKAYQAIKDTALQNRNGLDTYTRLGYVASSRGNEATSKTIEYAYDDWCVARMAEALGHEEDADLFYRRSANYRNLFDRNVGFFRGRKAGGTWRSPFDPLGQVGDEYTESDAWQYLFAVQHDSPGLIDLFGGDKGFTDRLDTMFTMDSTVHANIPDISGLIGQYAHGNEPCHHVAYMYDYAGAPWKTQMRVRQIMATLYDDSPAGECGNVDCGQMSAWYVFSAMGFYPVNPVSNAYMIGSPAVDKATLSLQGGKKFSVVAQGNGPKNVYIQSATLNGKPFNQSWIGYDQVRAGGTLKLVMGPNPNPEFGKAPSERPMATMPKDFAYAALPPPSTNEHITLSLPIRITGGEDERVAGFVIDPNMTDGGVNGTDAKIDVSAPNAGPERLYMSERYGSDFTYKFPVPAGSYTVRLHFAEVFDSGVGERVEDVFLNGRLVLPNLDIFAVAGQNKALVYEYKDVKPDANGMVTIRVKVAKASPDQNAKINGIEILP